MKIHLFLLNPIKHKNKKYELEIQKLILEFIKFNGFVVNIISCDLHIFDSQLINVDDKDILFFHPYIASNNLSIINKYHNSIVLLRHKTLLIQKKI
jgi:hypothetical protein